MPHNKKEGILLSCFMSLIMIYVMAALNNDVKIGAFSAYSWVLALKRLPLGFLVGIICDLCICTPLSRKIVAGISAANDREIYQVFILRFCMVVFMTFFMTIFGVIAGAEYGMSGIISFFVYFPYNFTIAMPIQMIIVAPLSFRLVKKLLICN